MTAPSAHIDASIYLYPGFYLLRLARRGPIVAASVTFDEADGWLVTCAGQTEGPTHTPGGSWLMAEVAFRGQPTTESEFRYRNAVYEHATIYDPTAPAANPRWAINLNTYRPYRRKA